MHHRNENIDVDWKDSSARYQSSIIIINNKKKENQRQLL